MDEKHILACISENLRAARFRKRLTQEQVAEKANTSQRYLSRVELAQAKPSIVVFVNICHALEVEPAEILKFNQ
jgi:transcriptional regulator with XRE-family HTH domain